MQLIRTRFVPCLIAALFGACDGGNRGSASPTPASSPAPEAAIDSRGVPAAAPAAASPRPVPTPRPPGPDDIVVMSYNVRNYLRMPRFVDNTETPDLPKPESEIAAVVANIAAINPAILGVQEMGPRDQFDDFLARLKQGGVEFPYTKHLDAFDTDRHLAMLSKFPIIADNSVADAYYEMNGAPMPVQRGFLDVTVEIRPDYRLRLITVHLKSKRPAPEGEALMRRFEARLLRQHIDKIIEVEPDVRMLVFGDFNDTKDTEPIRDIMGVRGSHGYLTDLWVNDSDGDRWTHFYSRADSYSRIDYFFVSPALWRDVNKKASRIFDAPSWRDGSDHRPITAVLTLPRPR